MTQEELDEIRSALLLSESAARDFVSAITPALNGAIMALNDFGMALAASIASGINSGA